MFISSYIFSEFPFGVRCKVTNLSLITTAPRVAAHAFNPSVGEAEAGGSEFKASLVCIASSKLALTT